MKDDKTQEAKEWFQKTTLYLVDRGFYTQECLDALKICVKQLEESKPKEDLST